MMFSHLWLAFEECAMDLASLVAGSYREETCRKLQLASTNALGIVAVTASFAVCHATWPALAMVSLYSASPLSKGVMLVLGTSGALGFLATQVVFLVFEGQSPFVSVTVRRYSTLIYATASAVPWFAHVALHHGWFRYVLFADTFTLMAASYALAFIVSSSRSLLWQVPPRGGSCRRWCGSALEDAVIDMFGSGPANAAATAINGTRACAGFGTVFAFWLPSIFPIII